MYKNEAYDPCPKGWRLPDTYDFDKLIEHSSELVIYLLGFASDYVEIDPFGAPHDACSVRCVKDMSGQLRNPTIRG
jgi:hypothetical protein